MKQNSVSVDTVEVSGVAQTECNAQIPSRGEKLTFNNNVRRKILALIISDFCFNHFIHLATCDGIYFLL